MLNNLTKNNILLLTTGFQVPIPHKMGKYCTEERQPLSVFSTASIRQIDLLMST